MEYCKTYDITTRWRKVIPYELSLSDAISETIIFRHNNFIRPTRTTTKSTGCPT